MYLLTSPSPSFAPLIKPILTPQSITNTVLVVLLDWSEPWSWVRQLREWMLLLRTVLTALPDESKITMEEVMSQWKERGRGGSLNLDGTTATAANEGDVALPLGPGEWEEPLGLPLCVVCQNVSLPMEMVRKAELTCATTGRKNGCPREDAELERRRIRCRTAVHADNLASA